MMNKYDFAECVGMMHEYFIEESMKGSRQIKEQIITKWSTVAASVCLVIAAGFFSWHLSHSGVVTPSVDTPGETVVQGTEETAANETEPPSTEEIRDPAADFEYEVTEDGDAVYLTKYIGTSENVVIPSEIDGLPVYSLEGIPDEDDDYFNHEGVFEDCSIKTVTIPEGIVAIGRNAFRNCTELTDVSIPQSIVEISLRAFENCTKLEKIDLSETKISILSTCLFNGCTNLREVKLPESISEIYSEAFMNCSSLREISLPEDLIEIGMKAFFGCSSLSEIPLPENLMEIDDWAFADCTSLRTITIPAKAKLSFCFLTNVPSLEKIIFEEGREELTETAAISIISGPEIIIPESVKTFSPEVFSITKSSIQKPPTFVFLGDLPELVDTEFFDCDPTIYYDPGKNGWEDCVWQYLYTLEPISNITS